MRLLRQHREWLENASCTRGSSFEGVRKKIARSSRQAPKQPIHDHDSSLILLSDTTQWIEHQPNSCRQHPSKALTAAPITISVNVDLTTTPGSVTPVRDQGFCGSCWAFAAMESLNFLKGAPEVDLSEQQLVECSRPQGNYGFNGGWDYQAYEYVLAKGITTEAIYPYIQSNSMCNLDGGAFKIVSYANVSRGCLNLVNNLVGRPLSVTVVANGWQSYSSGILSTCSGRYLH